MPIDICLSCGARMPVADCSVDLWRSLALWRSASVRVAQAASVTANALGPAACSKRLLRRTTAASAQASTRPEDKPMSAKLTTRQRLRPFLDEADAGVDHRRAVPQRRRQHERGHRQPGQVPALSQRQPPQRDTRR